MWVRLSEYMIVDGEPPMPQVGMVLTGLGLRARGEVTPAPADLPDGIVAIKSDQPRDVVYQVTGRIVGPRDFITDGGRGSVHAGMGFVVHVGDERYQVQSDGWAREMQSVSRVTLRGRFEVVGDYEWDAFGLEDTRSDWLVQTLASGDHGDAMLDLIAPSDD